MDKQINKTVLSMIKQTDQSKQIAITKLKRIEVDDGEDVITLWEEVVDDGMREEMHPVLLVSGVTR